MKGHGGTKTQAVVEPPDEAPNVTRCAAGRGRYLGFPTRMRVEEATAPTAEIVSALGRLVGQLSSTAAIPTGEDIQELVTAEATRLLLARDEDQSIVGMLTLVLLRIPSGVRAWIEDVVVDQAARGRGAGSALTEEALRLARAAGARTVELTSRPERSAADRLYESLGFRRRRTNVYRYELSQRQVSI